jgi:3-phosphoglycerate kinase
MTLSHEKTEQTINALLAGRAAAPELELTDYLAAVPRLKALDQVASGTPVLVRGDVDCKPGAKVGDGDIRLRSMVETLEFGRTRGWKQVIFGHIGREPEKSLAKVATRLGEILNVDVPLVTDWFDASSQTIAPAVNERITAAKAGSVLMLENTRRYDIERVLWKAKPADAAKLAEPLTKFANECADNIARVYVNEALSAGSLDASSTIVPLAMDRVALGKYVAGEFDGPMRRCLKTELVVFSGLKIDKLDDLEAMIGRGTIRLVFAAGSLAMALKKAIGELDSRDVCLGVAEDPAHAGKPYYIPRERVEQAKAMVRDGREKGIEFVVPIDSVIADGSVVDELKPGQQQFDVGPNTTKLFEQKIGEFLTTRGLSPFAESAEQKGTVPLAEQKGTVPLRPASADPPVAFHNGVFGMFEDPRFEAGTKNFMPQLKRMKDAGAEVYIGGGEGGTALEKYGQPDWVTHVFTAGGTVLNALGREPVPYLATLRAAAGA